MISKKFDSEQEWLEARRGKISGTRLKDIIVKRGTAKKMGFYELIAERLGVPPDDESARERGKRLEDEAIEKFTKETKKKVDASLMLWIREDNENIALSPDGVISDKEAIEVKCLASANHIKAFLTQEIPKDYEEQVIQYFIVNDDLETLYLAFYDPRLQYKDFFYLTIKRKEFEDKIKEYKEFEEETLKEINEIVNKLTF